MPHLFIFRMPLNKIISKVKPHKHIFPLDCPIFHHKLPQRHTAILQHFPILSHSYFTIVCWCYVFMGHG